MPRIIDEQAAVSPQRTDVLLGWQLSQVPHTRAFTPAQLFGVMVGTDVNAALGYAPLAANQAITLSGDISGTGTTAIATTLAGMIAGNHTFTGTINVTGAMQAGGVPVLTSSSVVIGSGAFLNAGTIVNGGTVTQAAIDNATLINSGGTVEVGTLAYANLPASAQHRTLEFAIVGQPGASQVYQIVLTEAGTLVANSGGAQGNVIGDPTATWDLTLSTVHNGTVTTQGTVAISTAGSITFPSFSAVTCAAGDSVRITNQATPDATGSDVALAFRYLVT